MLKFNGMQLFTEEEVVKRERGAYIRGMHGHRKYFGGGGTTETFREMARERYPLSHMEMKQNVPVGEGLFATVVAVKGDGTGKVRLHTGEGREVKNSVLDMQAMQNVLRVMSEPFTTVAA